MNIDKLINPHKPASRSGRTAWAWEQNSTKIVEAFGKVAPDATYFVSSAEADQGVVSSGDSLRDILVGVGTTKKATVVFIHDGVSTTTTYTVGTTFDASSYTNVSFVIGNGAVLALSVGVTLTLPSPEHIGAAPFQRIFSGLGTVAFGASGVIYAEWWGVDGTADEVQIQQAIESVSGLNGATIKLLPKNYNTTSTIAVNRDRINILGSGEMTTRIVFTPTADDVCIEWHEGATMISQCTIRDLSFYSTEAVWNKDAMRLVDIDIFEMKNVSISGPTVDGWTGGTESIGLRIQGRNIGSIQNIHIKADLPISIEDNPNNAIDIDHFNFNNLYLISKSDNTFPCVRIADGVNLTNVIFDGVQAWAFGSYGLYWADTTSAVTSNNLSIKNVRWEQSTSGNYAFFISRNAYLQNVLFENIYSGSTTDNKGYYLRTVLYVSFKNIIYAGTLEALNIDDTCNIITFNNFYSQVGSTASTTGLTQVWADAPHTNLSPIPNNCFYADTSSITDRDNYIFGVRHWKGTGTVAGSGGNVSLPIDGPANPLAIIRLIGHSATGPIQEGGIAFQTPDGVTLISGTANFDVGSVAGKLCVVYNAGGSTQIRNNTAQTLTYLCQIEWVE